MIRIHRVTRRFGRMTAVSDVSLDVPAGDSVALWGGNGAGKTTLLRCVLGLLRFEGQITVGGHDVLRDGKRARMLVGYVPQELGFYDELRVSEAIAYFAALKRLATSPADVLQGVGLAGSQRKRIRDLSGGMKQRLALGIAMLGDPPVLVLDEVTASLDACGRDEFVTLLRSLAGRGRTLLFASHRLEEVTTLARRVVVMKAGQVAAESAPEQFAAGGGDDAVLHLTMRLESRQRALAVLADGGFAARHNGRGILVRVPMAGKARPFQLLGDAGVAVDDFHLAGADAMLEAGHEGGLR